MAQFIETYRGGKALLYEGYKYLKIRDGKDYTFWRCERHRSQCSAKVTTHESTVQSCRGEHNHPPDVTANQVVQTIGKMRKRAHEESTTIPLIYNEALQDLSQCANKESVAANMPTLSFLKSNLYRERRKRLPPMPQTRAEVTLAGDWAYTLGGEPFILAEEGTDDKIILLGTQSNLHHLAEAECLYMDGTFQTCPHLFYQIFSIHIVKYG